MWRLFNVTRTKKQKQANIAQTKAAVAKARTVDVGGKKFRVAHIVERNQALVDLVGPPAPYYVKDVQAAARAVTGCNGAFSPGILAFVGGDINKADLYELSTKRSDKFWGWAVSLKC